MSIRDPVKFEVQTGYKRPARMNDLGVGGNTSTGYVVLTEMS